MHKPFSECLLCLSERIYFHGGVFLCAMNNSEEFVLLSVPSSTDGLLVEWFLQNVSFTNRQFTGSRFFICVEKGPFSCLLIPYDSFLSEGKNLRKC